MKRVALISDTHIPSRADAIPTEFESKIREADFVVHAGDFETVEGFEAVAHLSDQLTAVSGNMDADLDLPHVATLTVENVQFVVTHGAGSPYGYEDRVASVVREHMTTDPVVGVSGHTHSVLETEHGGVRLLNPGSVTGARPASRPTMMVATVTDGTLDVELYER